MSIRNRTVTVITGAAVATALAGAAAFAAVPSTTDAVMLSGMPAHMESFDDEAFAEMQQLMESGAPRGQLHRVMRDQGIDLGQMHGDMARSGMNHGQMHRTMATIAG